MRETRGFRETFDASAEVEDLHGNRYSICDAAVRGGYHAVLERSERKSPSVEVAYPDYFNSEVVDADGQVVSVQPSCVQAEHPEMFDGTESADVWKSLR